jgi:hypothetical protein
VKKLFNWLIVLAACVGVFYGVGLIVPRNRTLAAKAVFGATPPEAYAVLSDVSTWPEWHPDVASAREAPERGKNPVWRVQTKDGRAFEVEVMGGEEDKLWSGVYTFDGTRTTLRFDLLYYGQGSRLRLTRIADTRDPWLRAKGFFFSASDAEPVAVLKGLGSYFGESVKAEAD